ncbi:hypothetical protein B0I03_10537 [Flavobacterium aquaticum]|uniref:Uncharacterized protein n=1 Tax=Flavobacterium aquaticum TaxID=1236486 RepID=A0A327YPL8_9FLAO|nr:hypothetical protein [Flavobacterium aquaticum]RAK21605.1 hypothetical protein B0I03_10537 [Flavobacterium aquaticum]
MNKERLEELLQIGYEQIMNDESLRNEMMDYYKFLFPNSGCSNCKNKHKKYFDKLQSEGVELLKPQVENSGFKLRNNIGVLGINFGGGKSITIDNAPDELCIEFLKANPNRISLFEVYPENWVELINNENDNADEE